MNMKSRIDITKRSLAGVAVASILVLLFIIIASFVVHGKTVSWDTAILLAITDQSNAIANTILFGVTHLGDVAVIVSLAALLVCVLKLKKKAFEIPYVILAVGGAIVLNASFKLLFQRERPELWNLLAYESTFSFPSGHSLITSAFVVFVIGLLWNTKWRVQSLIGGILYVVLIGFSRLYLGVHYPSDVMAGWCLGVAWGLFVLVIMNEYSRRPLKNVQRTGS